MSVFGLDRSSKVNGHTWVCLSGCIMFQGMSLELIMSHSSRNPGHSAPLVSRGENRSEENDDDFGESHLRETDLRLETVLSDIVSIS